MKWGSAWAPELEFWGPMSYSITYYLCDIDKFI